VQAIYGLLVVDDEKIIADGLYDFFNNEFNGYLRLYKAYSAIQALEVMGNDKIDIVLTDINMPKLSGLDMHKEIIKKWPRCKVIFLTGYNEFEYIQTAIRNNGIDYILKSEDDEVTLNAVRKALSILEKEFSNEELVETVQKNLYYLETYLENGQEDAFNDVFNQLISVMKNKRSDQYIKSVNRIVSNIQSYIAQNLHGDLSINKLAELTHFNPSYLSRLYKNMTGKSLSDYIWDVKLSKAKELLVRQNIRINEIAAALGFDSPAYFTKFFKKFTNKTPLEFREMFYGQ